MFRPTNCPCKGKCFTSLNRLPPINLVLCQYRYAHFISIDILAFHDGYKVVVYICSEPFPCRIASFSIDEHLMFSYIRKLLNVLRKWFTFNSMASINVIVICWNYVLPTYNNNNNETCKIFINIQYYYCLIA